MQLLPQGQGDGHDHHPVAVVQLHVRHHAGLHGQPRLALGAEQHLIHRANVDACFQQLRRDAVGVRRGVGVDEAARVGGNGHIQQQGDGGRYRRQLPDDAVNDLAAGGGIRVQARLRCEKLLRAVVVDGQLNAAGISGGVVRQQVQRRDVGGHDVLRHEALRCPVGLGVGGVGVGDLRVIEEIRGFAHIPQSLTQRGGRADGVAVGAHMGQQQHVVHLPQPRRRLLHRQAPVHSLSSGSTMSALAGLAGLTWFRRSRICAPWAMESSMKNCSSGV